MCKEELKEVKRLGRPREKNTWTSELLNDRAREYFNKCDNRVRKVVRGNEVIEVSDPAPYVIHGLCNYLDISTPTFYRWRLGEGCSESVRDKAISLHQRITDNRISGALDGRQNSAFAKFLLTNDNADEYRDKVEIETGMSEEVRSLFEMCKGLEIGKQEYIEMEVESDEG